MIIGFACGSISIRLHYTKPYFCVFYLPYIFFSFWQQQCSKITRRCKFYHNEIEYWTLMTYVASLACKLGTVLLSVKAILISVSCNIVCTSTEIPTLECKFLCLNIISSGLQSICLHTQTYLYIRIRIPHTMKKIFKYIK